MLESEMDLRTTAIRHNRRCVFARWLQLPDKTFEAGLHFLEIRISHWPISLYRAGH